ncbi:hypothetical protein [Acidovorax sp.]|uniref:hypothetical protein n=1 Tax=Acidovorax sp. TaxID=1872122 RepID=UPI00391F9B47
MNLELHRAVCQLLFGQFAIENPKFSRGPASPIGIPSTAAADCVTTPTKYADGMVAAGIFLGKFSNKPLSIQCHIDSYRARIRFSPNAGNRKFARLSKNRHAQRKSGKDLLHKFS